MAVSITRAVTLHRIGLRLSFAPGALDAERLARSVRLSLDAEPILGCSFDTSARKASWSRLASLDEVQCFRATESLNPDADMIDFQTTEVPDLGPQADVLLLRASDADHLGIKLSHVLADGQAAKQYAYLLSDIYSKLSHDEDFVPKPNLADRPTGRDVWSHLTAEQRRQAKRAKSWVNPTWTVPRKGKSGGHPTYVTAFLEPDQFRRLKSRGRELDATVNDVMLTAVFRACVALLDPPTGVPLSLMSTADLRRYLPERERMPISNISISGSLDIERVDGESFEETLMRVRESMARWAQQCYGAGPFASAEKLTALGYGATQRLMGLVFRAAGGSGKTYPWYTNIGILDDSRLRFDGAVPTSGHMFGPLNRGGAIVPVISTYRERLAVTMGFCEGDIDRSLIEDFLRITLDELDALTATCREVLSDSSSGSPASCSLSAPA